MKTKVVHISKLQVGDKFYCNGDKILRDVVQIGEIEICAPPVNTNPIDAERYVYYIGQQYVNKVIEEELPPEAKLPENMELIEEVNEYPNTYRIKDVELIGKKVNDQINRMKDRFVDTKEAGFCQESKMYSMSHIPLASPNPSGQEFSETVLVFDEEGDCSMGYYSFGDSRWNIFDEDSQRLVCWCYIPIISALKFIREQARKNGSITFVKHYGYRD